MSKVEKTIQMIRTNSSGKGRPRKITKLICIFLERPREPKRITIEMRVRLDDILKAKGIKNDRILIEGENYTRLWV